MKSAVNVLSLPNVQLMLPVMAFAGLELGYWQTVYPTCIGATKHLGVDSNRLVGLCSIFTGLGDMSASLILFTKDQHRKRGYFMAIVCTLASLAFLLPMLSLPPECTSVDSYNIGIITPSPTLLMISAFCLGLLDGTVNSQLYSLIGLAPLVFLV